MALYNGFSTYNRVRKFRVTDFELVKQNLFNHFRIRKGEKLFNPEFGTIIWSVIFEPFNNELHDAIVDDVKRIVRYDPRVSVENVFITEQSYGLSIEMEVTYIPENQTETIALSFDKTNLTVALGKF
jgi:phage baseplate assembly protein W